MRRRLRQLPRTTAVAAMVAAGVVAATGGAPATGATGQGVVTTTIVSQTQIGAGGCATGGAATTFGLVQTGAIANPGVDCTVTFGSSNDTSMLHAYQSDGLGSAMYRMTGGQLDQNWDASVAGNGQFTVTGNSVINWLTNRPAAAVQHTTGRVVAAYVRSTSNVNVVRFEEDGDLDPTFATSGRYATTENDWASTKGVAVAPDGSVFVGSNATALGNRDVRVLKLTPNGARDTTFDGDSGTADGAVNLVVDAAGNDIGGIELMRDGDIVVFGQHDVAGIPKGWVVRLDPQGRRDTSFGGGDGMIDNFDSGLHTYIEDVVEQPDGKLVLAGWEWAGDQDVVMGRLLVDGSLDPSWDGPGTGGGSDGVFWVPGPGSVHDKALGVALLPDGDLLAVGSTAGGGGDVYAVRFNGTDGTLDTGWDGPSGTGNGRVQLTISAGADRATDVLVAPSGEIFVGGTTTVGGFGTEQLLLKLRGDGTLDPTFDGDSGSADGAVRVTGTANDEETYEVALGPDGDIVLPGTTDAASDLLRITRFDGGTLLDYDDDNVAADNNWAEGTGFFGVCLRTFTGTSAAATWTANATCPADDTSDHWRAVPVYGTAAKVGQLGSRAVDGVASFRFALRVPSSQVAGTYQAPVTFDVIAPAI